MHVSVLPPPPALVMVKFLSELSVTVFLVLEVILILYLLPVFTDEGTFHLCLPSFLVFLDMVRETLPDFSNSILK